MKDKALYDIYKSSTGICTDTRNIKPGSIFFALKGQTFDGNKFAQEALEKGALHAVIDNPEYHKNENTFLVNDTLATLQELSTYHIQSLKPGVKVIGLTGSNGKTTTKELIASVLSKKYNVCFTKGNLNNHIGVPLTLLSITSDHEIAVIEMGANHVGEIALLSSIAVPDLGLITNIGTAHLEGFGSKEGILRGKLELFKSINENKGICFINASDNALLENTGFLTCEKYYYGNHPESYLSAKAIKNNRPLLSIKLSNPESITITTNLIGDYNLDNVISAMALGKYFEIPLTEMKKAVEQYLPQNNRSQYIKTQKNRIVMDAYNANPSSMKASIRNFLQSDGDNKVAILGEMKELGNHSNEAHQEVVDMLLNRNLTILLVGKGFEPFHQISDIFYFEDTDKLIEWLNFNRILDSNILIKGSRSNMLEKILNYL